MEPAPWGLVARAPSRAEEVVMGSGRSRADRERLAGHARAMRWAPTRTEWLLWQELRQSRLGVAFRRQVVVGGHIVDFCAPGQRLVVEVDGGYHAGRGRADGRRQQRLEALGYRVLRLPAALVEERLAEAVALVRAALGG